jgi:hypothetical protein
LRTLLIYPAESRAHLVTIVGTARAISDALDGHLLDDFTAELPGGQLVTFYLAETSTQLPTNQAAATLAARVGLHDRRVQSRIRGPVLVTGLDETFQDVDVPEALLALAQRAGIFQPEA